MIVLQAIVNVDSLEHARVLNDQILQQFNRDGISIHFCWLVSQKREVERIRNSDVIEGKVHFQRQQVLKSIKDKPSLMDVAADYVLAIGSECVFPVFDVVDNWPDELESGSVTLQECLDYHVLKGAREQDFNFRKYFALGSPTQLKEILSQSIIRRTFFAIPKDFHSNIIPVSDIIKGGKEISQKLSRDFYTNEMAFSADQFVTFNGTWLSCFEYRAFSNFLRNEYPASLHFLRRLSCALGRAAELHFAMENVRVLSADRIDHKSNKPQPKLAVFIHAFYVSMMENFIELLKNIPSEFDLYISTYGDDSVEKISQFMDGSICENMSKFEVRGVHKNRGRDMSSLFITFREEVLNGGYDICLRLHSKKTPQVQEKVSAEFQRHLYDNLLPNKEYVQNTLNLFADDENLGLVCPPVIHIGFNTIGSAWYVNRPGVAALVEQMSLPVRVDRIPPPTPYGTMYFFRPKALAPMFAHPWQFEQYNEEPNHIDGGLAHQQERLIYYACVGTGYHTINAISDANIDRAYSYLIGRSHTQCLEPEPAKQGVIWKLASKIVNRMRKYALRNP